MKLTAIFKTAICLFILGSCSPGVNKNSVPKDFGEIKDAKGYYKEGDKKYKIFRGGVFRTNEINSFKSLFPIAINHAVSSRIALQVYQGLVKLNQRTLEVEPLLAKDFNVSEDGKIYTFTLNDSVFFHDDSCFSEGKGRMLNANDIKFCFDILCSSVEDNTTANYLTEIVLGAKDHFDATSEGKFPENGVEGVRVIDQKTIEIELTSAYSYFLKILSQACCTIYPKEAYDMYGSRLNSHAVGTGPFILKNQDINQKVGLEMKRNLNYWENDNNGNNLPYIDIIKITFNNNKKQELKKFKTGDLDMVYQLPVEDLNEVLVSLDSAKTGGNPEFKLQSNKDGGLSTSYYCFNMLNPIFKKQEVRLAFNLAIDRQKITKYTLHGEADPAIHGLVPSLGANDHKKIKGFNYDPELAKSLLSKAGFPNGKGFPIIELDVNESNYLNEKVAVAVQKMLMDNLGVSIQINYHNSSALIDKFNNGNSDFWGITWIADYPDQQNFLQTFNGAIVPPKDEPSYTNHSRYQNIIFDRFYFDAIHARNQQSAMDNYAKADSVLIADAAFLPLYYGHKIRLLQNNVHALPINSMEYRDFTRVFLSKN
jgi:peptide/nickel transport system substrate-binding protein